MLARERADALITYMHLMYKKAKATGVRIDRDDLVAQGARRAVPGVEEWFDAIARLREAARRERTASRCATTSCRRA